MLKDIPNQKVEDIAVAVVPRSKSPDRDALWDVYLCNMKDQKIKNVLINSKGYGYREGERVETGTFRYYFEALPPNDYMKIEPIQTSLFDITHEFFLTFTLEGHMYDKKYLFVSGSIDEVNFTKIPILNKKGVMIK